MEENYIVSRLKKHRDFWSRRNKRPLLGFSIGDYFFARRFEAAAKLIESSEPIRPDMLQVDKFLADYERMHGNAERTGQDILFTAAPYAGIPWMEAIAGCEVHGTGHSFVASTQNVPINELSLKDRIDQTWRNKYLEFVQKLNETGRGRYPVGQPILRGPTDVLGAIIGENRLVFAIYDSPSEVKRLFLEWADIYRELILDQRMRIDPFYDGYSMGFYDLWCPGSCIWFQDDLNALLSPDIYKNIVHEAHSQIPKGYDFSLFHLHPASFFLVDILLETPGLTAIQINKDEGGPSVSEMLPVLRKVRACKNLVLWGDFTPDEYELLKNELEPGGLYIMIVIESHERSKDYEP